MDDLLLAITCRVFIEHLALKEHRHIVRYVNDILERVNAGHTQKVTDYLNSIDHIGNMKFNHKAENRQIHFQPFWKWNSMTPPTEVFKSKWLDGLSTSQHCTARKQNVSKSHSKGVVTLLYVRGTVGYWDSSTSLNIPILPEFPREKIMQSSM